MKKIVGLCATFLFIIVSFSLNAEIESRLVIGQVTHTNSSGIIEGVESEIEFSTSGESSFTVFTSEDGIYSTTVTPNKQYSCRAMNQYGSQTKVLTSGTVGATLNFHF